MPRGVLFPGNSLPVLVDEDDVDAEAGLHGMQKLLSPSADLSLESWRSLRAGLAVLYHTAPVSFPVPGVGMAKFWGFMGQVWKGGKGLVVRTGD